MATFEGGTSGALIDVGVASGSAAHVSNKPIPVVLASGGHYRTSHRAALIAAQAANSALFELQNASVTNLIVITRVCVGFLPTAAQTAAIETSLDMYRLTGFSVVDTTNTVTPVASKLRTSYAASAAVLRGVTVAGAAAGMTGGTKTKDTAPLWQLPLFLLAAVPTASQVVASVYDWQPDIASGEAPLVLVQNEGFLIENRVVHGAAGGGSFYINVEWVEVTAY
jgi:hypothetical protein